MRLSKSLAALAAVIVTFSVAAEPPGINFGRDGVTIHGYPAGTRVAWIAMLRKRADYLSRMRIVRGVEPVTPAGNLFVATEEYDSAESVWVVVALDTRDVQKVAAPGYPISTERIPVTAVAGEDHIVIKSAKAHVAYVRQDGARMWSVAAVDGADLDRDGAQNGSITLPLRVLSPFRGGNAPLSTVQQGDLILLIDSIDMRADVVEVLP